MKLYHGSPKKMRILKPIRAKGINDFENQKAIFLCKTFDHAALYAIGKSLKGKKSFLIKPSELVVVGKCRLPPGYVYEVDVSAQSGSREQYAFGKEIRNFKIKKVYPKNYLKKIIFVKTKEELLKYLK